MKTIDVSEASDATLDWLVAKCEGMQEFWLASDEFNPQHEAGEYHYSTDWSQGGPIIERKHMEFVSPYKNHPEPAFRNLWCALCPKAPHLADGMGPAKGRGPTMLIGAMRAFVASELGGTVEVPEELAQNHQRTRSHRPISAELRRLSSENEKLREAKAAMRAEANHWHRLYAAAMKKQP